MTIVRHLMKVHHILSLTVRDLRSIKEHYPELFAAASQALNENKQQLKKAIEANKQTEIKNGIDQVIRASKTNKPKIK